MYVMLCILVFDNDCGGGNVVHGRPYAQLFQKWTYTFGRKIIELSSRYPLISGFYKLLAVTITTADSVGFFSFSGATTQSSHGTEASVVYAHDKAHTAHVRRLNVLL